MRWLRRELARIRTRLLAVNLLVLLVPPFGLEFARLYERQLLDALERDMRDQAEVVRAFLEADPSALGPRTEPALVRAARGTRTRVRLLDGAGRVVADSHANGPPEGPEPVSVGGRIKQASRELASDTTPAARWPDVPERQEVRRALETGALATQTRVRAKEPAVFLFLALPVATSAGRGVVYVTRSTQPAIVELYRVRRGLWTMLWIAALATGALTLLLAWSLSRPLGRLAAAARRVAGGEREVEVPVGGSGEVRELGEAVAAMQAELAARARKVSDFAADVAHEFKSPLTSLRGAAELLREGAANDPEARERFLANIELDVERLDLLVSRLLELSRIEAGAEPPGDVDVAAIAARVASRLATPEVAVRVIAGDGAPLALAREADVEAALGNLVDNAVRVTPPGGEVLVRVSREDDRVRADVEDAGPGVPEALRDRVWERFFTTDAERSGTGLGLAIVRAVALGAGGRCGLESPAEGGARFWLSLPAATPDRRRRPSAPPGA